MTYKDWKNVFVDKTIPIKLYQRNTPESDIIKKKALSGEIKLNVNVEKQGRHDKSSKLYKEGKSYMTISMDEIQDIVNEYAGTGELLYDAKGNWQSRETMKTQNVIGVSINQTTKEETETDWITIHYSKTGVHVVPKFPKKER